MYAAELRRLLRQGALTNQRSERTLPQKEGGRLRSAALNLKIFDFDAAERMPQLLRVESWLLGQIRGEILQSGFRMLSVCSSSHIFQHFFTFVDAHNGDGLTCVTIRTTQHRRTHGVQALVLTHFVDIIIEKQLL
ncbi:unnamed protein product, partial [Ilex paraguariensis]